MEPLGDRVVPAAGLVLSEVLTNPSGNDSPLEYVELVATRDINFAVTPHTVVFADTTGTPGTAGWANGGLRSYAFAVTSGTVSRGDVVYVGGSGMAPTGTTLRTINTATTGGDGFGVPQAPGVLGNGGSHADGVAVFDVPVGAVTPSTVPVDAILFGTAVGTAAFANYKLPVSDHYTGGTANSGSFVAPDPGTNQILTASGLLDPVSGVWASGRSWSLGTTTTSGTSGVALLPVVSVAKIADAAEGGTAGTFRFTRTGSTSAALTVNYTVGGTATSGTDYTALTGTVTFAASAATADVSVAAINDSTPEFWESVIVSITDSSGYATDPNWGQATVRIVDNEAPVVSVAKIYDAMEGVESGVIQFQRTGDTTNALTINISVGGTATNGTDYTLIGSTVTFAAGEDTTFVEVEALTDNTFDPEETVALTIEAGTGYDISAGPVQASTIADAVSVVSATSSTPAYEDGIEGMFAFTRTGDLTDELTIDIVISGGATPGTDYESLDTEVTFEPGQSAVAVLLVPLDDFTADPGELVTLTIQSSTDYELGLSDSISAMIVDDESPLVTVTKSADAGEGASGATLQFHRTGDTSNSLTVNYTVGGTATPGTDFTALSGMVTFSANEHAASVPVSITDDSATEGTESLIVQVSSGSSYGADPDSTVIVSIADNDGDAGEIGGVVWEDDGDGIRETGEGPVVRGVVNLLDSQGMVLLQTLSDVNGEYHFGGLAEGTYFVSVLPPLLYRQVEADQGTDETADSDIDPVTRLSAPIVVSSGDLAHLLVGAGFVFADVPATPVSPADRIIFTDRFGNILAPNAPLRVAKWNDAFEVNPVTKNQPVSRQQNQVKGPGEFEGTKGTGFDFIDRDNDRFNIRVYDLDAYSKNTPFIPAELSTSEVAGFEAYKDTTTTISLSRIPDARWTGWYWSDSQMLVSNKTDDEYQDAKYLGQDDVNVTGASTNAKGDKGDPQNYHTFQVSDRTHRVALGATVSATYAGLPARTATVKVDKAVKLNASILKNGAEATNSKAGVEDDVIRMNEIYAQVGIRVIAAVGDPVNPPQGVNLVDGLAPYTGATVVERNGTKYMAITSSTEEMALYSDPALYAKDPANSAKKDTSVVNVYFVNNFTDRGRLTASALPAAGTSNPLFANVLAIGTNHNRSDLAHEVFHILENISITFIDAQNRTDAAHYPYFRMLGTYERIDSTNLMVTGDGQVFFEGVLNSVRLNDLQQARAWGNESVVKNPM